MTLRTTLAVASALAMIGSAFMARADVSDNFDNAAAGTDGWVDTGDPDSTITYFATGGNPGGYIQLHDAAEGTDDYFTAPAPYLGSKSQYVGGTLSFDLLPQFTATPDNDIFIVSPSVTLSYLFPTQPTGGSWQHFSVTLSPSDPNWHVSSTGGAAPTEAQFKTALASVTKLEILGDYINGTENNGLDNVVLHSIARLGDANLDGHVDLSDLNIVLNNLGTTNANWTGGNFDGAATIDLTDLNDVLNNLGTSFPAPSQAAPEPASLALFSFAVLPLLSRRKTRLSR